MTEKIEKSNNGGKRPGSGRKKGAPNKKTAAMQAAIAAEGITPLAHMLKVMRDPTVPLDVQNDMAKSAAPYVHPKLAQVSHTGKDGKDLVAPTDPVDIARRVAFILSAALAAKE